MPEALDADGFDTGVSVRNNPIGGVAPYPIIGIAGLGGIVLAAGVYDEGVVVVDFRPHSNGCEVTHYLYHTRLWHGGWPPERYSRRSI